MKTMILAATLGLLVSCGKEVAEMNYLPGKWDLVKTELYENDSLKAVNVQNEVSTVYYFSSCETAHGSACDMYIEEDGEQLFYSYTYDENSGTLQLNESSLFKVDEVSDSELLLVREYDNYKSTYQFKRGE